MYTGVWPMTDSELCLKTDNQSHITPSVAQKHICIRHEGAYTVKKALELFNTTEELDFGQVAVACPGGC